MTAISGNNYAGFSSSMVQGAQLFMNNFANQTGGGGWPMSATASRWPKPAMWPAIATTPPKWGAWGGALGGLGTIGANQPVGSVTYNAGGFAAGLDRLDHRHLPDGRHRRLHHRHPVGLGLRWPGPLQHLPGRPLWRLRPGQGLCRCPDRLRLHLEPDVAEHPHPRPAAAHRLRPDRRQPVLRPDRDRLPLRPRHQRQRLRHAVRAAAGLHGQPERLHRDRRAVAEPLGGAADRPTRCAR